MLNGYDIDGVILPNKYGSPGGVVPEEPCVIISGRTFQEYCAFCRQLALKYPVYIRGSGESHDHEHGGRFKAAIIKLLGVTTFHEDNPVQANIIRELCPDVEIVAYPWNPPF